MSRKLRIEYPGAMYRVMNRGDQREDIFKADEDRQSFLSTLGEACGKTDWQVHAYCLMRNDGRTAARRLRQETTTSLKWIALRLHMGSWTYVSNLLNEPPQRYP
jgi:hypothetical protein